MKVFAYVVGGLPLYTISSAVDAQYIDGQVVGDGVMRECPVAVSAEELIQEWCYSDSWIKRSVSPGRFYAWDMPTLSWVYDIAAARQLKATEISSACETGIMAGFVSAALGDDHHYPADMTDQANLTASVMRSTLTADGPAEEYPFKCADGAGNWQFRPHTAAQIQQVGKDAYQHILGLRQVNAVLQEQIALAQSEQDINSIAW